MAEAYLEIRDEQGATSRRLLDKPVLVVGRGDDADVILPSAGVSRRHAEIRRDGDGWRILDLGSRNGTHVAGFRVREHLLFPDEAVQVAGFTLTLREPAATRDPRRARTLDDSQGVTVNTLGQMAAPKVDSRQLFALQRLSRRLLETGDAQARLAMLTELATSEDLRGLHAVALRIGADAEATGAQPLSGPVSSPRALSTEFHLSRTALDAVRRGREPVLASRSAGLGGSGGLELSIMAPAGEAVVACPLRVAGSDIDLLYVVLPSTCGTGEWLALMALASDAWSQAEAAWDARRKAEAAARLEQELAQARDVQRALLPQRLDVSPSLDVALHYEPYSGVAGDYVDVLLTPDGRVLLAVADVCGKGMQAALIAACVRTFVHAAAGAGTPIDLLVTRLGEHLATTLTEASFVTMVAALLDPASGELELVCAGHPPPIVADARGARLLEPSVQLPLGILPETRYERTSHRLEPGELLALYTDGLTELQLGPERWLGCEGLAAELAEAGQAERCAAAAERLAARLRSLAAGRRAEDDQTFLLARRCG